MLPFYQAVVPPLSKRCNRQHEWWHMVCYLWSSGGTAPVKTVFSPTWIATQIPCSD